MHTQASQAKYTFYKYILKITSMTWEKAEAKDRLQSK